MDALPDLGPKYRLASLIAKGGMAAVYLGKMQRGDGPTEEWQTVAIKVMHQHIAGAQAAAMFIDEARVGMEIDHPNVVRVFDTDIVGDTPFLLMEYVEGLSWSRTLRRLEESHRAVPVPLAVRVVHDVLLGLAAAHELAIVHRDVSPQNILLGTDGRVRITDFGIAKFLGRVNATAPGELRGKFGYLSPEQIGTATVDQRADVFAAGIVLWEALTGHRLFFGETQAETIARILGEPIPPPSQYRPSLDTSLEDVCLRALERDPDRRYATAKDFAAALKDAAGGIIEDHELKQLVDELSIIDVEKSRRALRESDHLRAVVDATMFSAPPASQHGPSVRVIPVIPHPPWPSAAGADARLARTFKTTPPPSAKRRWQGRLLISFSLIVAGVIIGRMQAVAAPPPPPPPPPPPTVFEPVSVSPPQPASLPLPATATTSVVSAPVTVAKRKVSTTPNPNRKKKNVRAATTIRLPPALAPDPKPFTPSEL